MSADNKPLNNHITGITFFAIAVFLIVVMNAFAKMATDYHHPIEIVFYRGIIAMILLLMFAKIKGYKKIYKTSRLRTHMLRGLMGNIGVVLVFWAYALMPMADVTAILFCAPLMVTIMSALFLKEEVGIWRWLAVVTGFLGVLVIVQPSGDGFMGYGTIITLIAAFSSALVGIFLRDLGRTENSLTTVFYFLGFGIGFSGIYMVFKGTLPHPEAIWYLAGVGVAAIFQLLLKTQAHRLAEASLLSPINYTSIIWASLFGWMFWQELPTLPVILGATIIIVSNLFILHREQSAKSNKA